MARISKHSPHLARTLRDGFWQIDFTVNGQRYRQNTGTPDAKVAGRMAQARYDAAVSGQSQRTEMALSAACARYSKEQAGWPAYHGTMIARGIGNDVLLSGITDAVVARMIVAWQADELKPGTINRYLSSLAIICKRALDVWHVAVGPWTRAKHSLREPEGRDTFLTQDQATALIAALVPHARPIVTMMLLTGLRRSNVLNLRWQECVPFGEPHLSLIQKGGRRLTVPLVPAAISVLEGLNYGFWSLIGPVWTFGQNNCDCQTCKLPSKRGLQIRSIRTAFKAAATRAGVNPDGGTLRFHDMRHTLASWTLAATGDVRVTQEILGHKRIATTMRYAHLLPGAKAAALGDATAGFVGR